MTLNFIATFESFTTTQKPITKFITIV